MTYTIEPHIETLPKGTWIGDIRILELAKDGFILTAFGDVRDLAKNEPESGTTKYVFNKISPATGSS